MEIVIKLNSQAVQEDPDLMKWVHAIQLMADRMSTSHFKYGDMRNKYPHSSRPIDTARQRMDRYDGGADEDGQSQGAFHGSGNTEECLDAANMLIIEHILPSHPKAKFKSQTAKQSPGLVWRED